MVRTKEKNELYARHWHVKKTKILHALKINGCAICGYNKCDKALDFHHVNPKYKKYQIIAHHISKPDFINELNKCILLCKNCHSEIEMMEIKNGE